MSALTLAPAAVLAIAAVGLSVLTASASAAWALLTAIVGAIGTVGTSLLAADATAAGVLAVALTSAVVLAVGAAALFARATEPTLAPVTQGGRR